MTNQPTLLNNPIHDMPFMDWLQSQAIAISEFSDTITQIENEETKEGVVSLAKVNKCLAKYTWFYTTQTAFYQIYKKRHRDLEREAKGLYDRIYMEIKKRATDKDDEIGKRYLKKGATMDEIKREAALNHPEWRRYLGLKNQIDELHLKIRAQLRNLNIIDKLDINLQVLKKQSEKEIKYLHLD